MAKRGDIHPWTKDERIADLQHQVLHLRNARDQELPVIKALWKRAAALWPAAEPFTERDVVVAFHSREDADAFSAALAAMGQRG